MKTVRNIFSVVSNKYFITLLAFVIWMIFFDDNNFINQHRLNNALQKVEQEREFYISEIKRDRQTAFDLESNQNNLERFAREEYLMKRENEDVYIIIEETKDEREKRLEELN